MLLCIINALSRRAESIPRAQGVSRTNSKLFNPTDCPVQSLASIFVKSREESVLELEPNPHLSHPTWHRDHKPTTVALFIVM